MEKIISDLLNGDGVEHAFITRHGKVDDSGAPLIDGVGYYLKQVHGGVVHDIKFEEKEKKLHYYGEGDGMVTQRRGVWLCIKTADCMPIILYDPVQCVIGNLHSGWRSTLLNVVSNGILSMVNEYGSETSNIKMVVGPSICQEHFEVGSEVVEAFKMSDERFHEYKKKEGTDKYVMNLKAIAKRQAMFCGIKENNLEIMNFCTYGQEDLFYSYRRAKEPSRLWSLVRMKV